MQYDAAVTYPITEPKRSPIKKIMVILAIVIVLGGLAFLLVGYINKKHVDGISDALDSYVGVLKGNTGSEYPAIEVNLASTYEERQNYFNSLLSAYKQVETAIGADLPGAYVGHGKTVQSLANVAKIRSGALNDSDLYALVELYVETGAVRTKITIEEEIADYISAEDTALKESLIAYNAISINVISYLDQRGCVLKDATAENTLSTACVQANISEKSDWIALLDAEKSKIMEALTITINALENTEPLYKVYKRDNQ